MGAASVGIEAVLQIFSLTPYLQASCPEPGAVLGALHVLPNHKGGDTYLPFTHEGIDSER